jgi:hypothetical protein
MKDTQDKVTIRFTNGIELVDVPLDMVKKIAEILEMLAKLPQAPPPQVVVYPVSYPYYVQPTPYWGLTWTSATLTTGSTTRAALDANGAYNNHGELK